MSIAKLLGAYYLHTNGELIWKNSCVFQSDPEYFDSPLIKKVWYVPENCTRKFFIDFLTEAHSLGATRKSIVQIAKEISLTKQETKGIINADVDD